MNVNGLWTESRSMLNCKRHNGLGDGRNAPSRRAVEAFRVAKGIGGVHTWAAGTIESLPGIPLSGSGPSA